jgi:structure-specific endonuclease subunit SLX1
MNSEYFVYLICTLNEKYTYIGATTDIRRRLRQHNSEIKGGAKYTTQRGSGQWKRIAYVSGFPTWNDALKFEWRWKQLGRKRQVQKGIHRRLHNLSQLLAMEKPTMSATPYSLWPSPPRVHAEEGFPEFAFAGRSKFKEKCPIGFNECPTNECSIEFKEECPIEFIDECSTEFKEECSIEFKECSIEFKEECSTEFKECSTEFKEECPIKTAPCLDK